MNDDPMSVAQLAEYLRVDRSTIYRLLKKGVLPSFRVGGAHRFWKSEIDAWSRQYREWTRDGR